MAALEVSSLMVRIEIVLYNMSTDDRNQTFHLLLSGSHGSVFMEDFMIRLVSLHSL